SLRAGDQASNQERARLGMSKIYTDGWEVAPHYDNQSKRLEWGTRLRDERGQFLVNHTTRLLGRSGVMSATLVTGQETLAGDTKTFKASLQAFDYVAGQRYHEFREGDRVAEYGLAALVLGGAAAVASKKGF